MGWELPGEQTEGGATGPGAEFRKLIDTSDPYRPFTRLLVANVDSLPVFPLLAEGLRPMGGITATPPDGENPAVPFVAEGR